MSSSAHTPTTTVPAIFPSSAADAIRVVLASLAIGVLARIAIPVGPVPVTGQTLGVLAAGAVLGPRRGAVAVLLYLAQGLAGAPVFAAGTAGFAVLAGPTAGYLLGFVPAAWLAGLLSQSAGRPSVLRAASVLTLATATIYLTGAIVLSRFVGWQRVFATGIAPFLPGDAMKIGILAAALPASAWFRSFKARRSPGAR